MAGCSRDEIPRWSGKAPCRCSPLGALAETAVGQGILIGVNNSTAMGQGALSDRDASGIFGNSGTTAIGSLAQAGAGAAGQINATAVGFQASANAKALLLSGKARTRAR
jgi:hypothetical protein